MPDAPSPRPFAIITRSTTINELTFAGALLALVAIIFVIVFALVGLKDATGLRIMLWVMGGGLVLGLACLASPWIGTIRFKANAQGVEGEVDGEPLRVENPALTPPQ